MNAETQEEYMYTQRKGLKLESVSVSVTFIATEAIVKKKKHLS